MSDLLSIGSSGLRAYRSALATVSDNVANANTEGFSRRTVVMKESPVSSGTSVLYRPQINFGGVDAASVTRNWDKYKAADARLSGTEAGEADARLRWIQTVERALSDGEAGVGTRLTAVFNAADELAADPNGDFPRRAFLSAIDQAAAAFRQTGNDLAASADNIETEAIASSDLINSDLATLARLNVQIRKAGVGTSTYAMVADERDRLLDEIGTKVGINVVYDEAGSVRVTLSGSNELLLQDARPALIGVQRSDDGRLGFLVSNMNGSTGFAPQGGALSGLKDVSEQLAGRRAELDNLASSFATAMNDWSALGRDANGVAGQPLLAAANGATTMQALITDPNLVPAANTADGEFGNLMTLGAVRTASGVEDRWVALVASHAQAVSAAKVDANVTTARRDIAYAARDAVSGVDLDSEAADLLRYQQAYTACARIIQVARDTLQDVMNLF